MSWLGTPRGAFFMVAVLLGSGCGSESHDGLHAVNGTVRLDEQPLETGSITFFSEGKKSYATGGTIHAGQFAIPEQQGLPAGKYKVSITANQTIGPVSTDPNERMEHPPEVKSLVPKNYNAETKLRARIEAAADNVFEFNLKSN